MDRTPFWMTPLITADLQRWAVKQVLEMTRQIYDSPTMSDRKQKKVEMWPGNERNVQLTERK